MFFNTHLEKELGSIKELLNDYQAIYDAIWLNVPVIEFNADGYIENANTLFLNAVGYSLGEIKGRHHRIFCDTEYANSTDYQNFWTQIKRGEKHRGVFKRINASQQEIWLDATYFPVKSKHGDVKKVLKIASDVTQSHKDLER